MKNIFIILSLFILNKSSCKSKNDAEIPKCIQQKIEAIKSQKVTNPPTAIYSYRYNNQTVLYITSTCCDIPSSLYDNKCNFICSPDGGFTGKGDGKCIDFFDKRTDEKLIWRDSRKYN